MLRIPLVLRYRYSIDLVDDNLPLIENIASEKDSEYLEFYKTKSSVL
jgi:hypothetical protein